MNPILDETSLLICSEWLPKKKIETLAETLLALDQLGFSKSLVTTKGLADIDVGEGHGLRYWCFNRQIDEVARRFVSSRLDRQTHYLDGTEGLFTLMEGNGVIEPLLGELKALGLGFAAITNGICIAIGNASRNLGENVKVTIQSYRDDRDDTNIHEVTTFVTKADVEARKAELVEMLDSSIESGDNLMDRAPEIFSRLRFGLRAEEQLRSYTRGDKFFDSLLKHLRALDQGALFWKENESFKPFAALQWSTESDVTLKHAKFGAQRWFPVPEGFEERQWKYHTKLTGGAAIRLYFSAERSGRFPVVLIGYIGQHLADVSNPT